MVDSQHSHFSDEDVRRNLSELGYDSIPPDKLAEFVKDLELLVKYEQRKELHATTCKETDTSLESDEDCHLDIDLTEDKYTEKPRVKRIVRRLQSDGDSVNDSDFLSYDSRQDTERTDLYSQRSSREDYAAHLPRSFIRPKSACSASNQHVSNSKTDRVARFQNYQKVWSEFKTPGEKSRKELRWHIREQMATSDIISKQKPQKNYVPNGYKVPTEKKRQALRWEVRNNLALGYNGSRNVQYY